MQIKDRLGTGTYYQFDSYRLDPDSGTLRDGNSLVELTPKVFTTLLVLVEHRDTVLTKDELLTLIWPDQFVDQSNLSQNISVLRRSLGESESGKKYIATFPGRGYRFVGPVEVKRHCDDNLPMPPPAPGPPPSALNEVQATSINLGPPASPDGPNSTLRYRKFIGGMAVCAVILLAIVAFVIGKSARNSKVTDVVEDNTPVKLYAQMKAGLTQPSWSKNGKAIAFIAIDLSGTRSTVYIQSKGDIQPRSVVSDAGQYSSPSWSPDGSRLAFLHFAPGTAEIVIFDIQRNSSRMFTKLFPSRYGLNYRHLDWSPDGKFLVVDDKSRDSEPFGIYLIYIDSGQRVRLTYPDSDMIGDVAPSVSPDGTSVAFIRDIDFFEQDVYITSVRGRTYRRITFAHTLISDIGWRTNKMLALAANRGDGFRFWQVDLNGQDDKEAVASPVNSDRALQFSVSQNGQTVAFSNYSPNLDIWAVDLTRPSNGWVPVIQAPGENIRPAVSPDGRLLAFLSNVSGKFNLWVSRIDGTNASEVPTGALVPASFCWSSGGNFLIFSPQRVHGLYEASVHGDAPVRQINSMYTDPYSAVDGKSLFVREHFFIYHVPLMGGNAQEVTEQAGAPMAQSGDARYLYFSQGPMSTTIARLDLQTGKQDELTGSLIPGYSDDWALSSQGIFFLGQQNGRPTVSLFDFTSKREEPVAAFPGDLPQLEMSGFGISPDGKRLWAVRADPMPSDVRTTMFPSE
jgi:Tol biopolymer transport system component/DNA-binding winged helix-turn-helix (wHTH) protein